MVSAPTRAGLRIEIATPEALVASRNRDIPDIKLLAEAIGMTDAVELADLARRQYGEEQLEIHGGYDDMLLWCRSLAGMLWP